MKNVRFVYEELVHIQLDDDHIRNDSEEFNSPSDLNNVDEQKSYQKSVVMLQGVNT